MNQYINIRGTIFFMKLFIKNVCSINFYFRNLFGKLFNNEN